MANIWHFQPKVKGNIATMANNLKLKGERPQWQIPDNSQPEVKASTTTMPAYVKGKMATLTNVLN